MIGADLPSRVHDIPFRMLSFNDVGVLLMQVVDVTMFIHHITTLFDVEARGLRLLHDDLELLRAAKRATKSILFGSSWMTGDA